MKLTTARLKKIIKEELQKLNEDVNIGELSALFMNTYTQTLYGGSGADARLTFESQQLIGNNGIRVSKMARGRSGANAQEQNFQGMQVDLIFDQPIQKAGRKYVMLYDKIMGKRTDDFSSMQINITVSVKEINRPSQDVRDHGLQQGQIAIKDVDYMMKSGQIEFAANANYNPDNPDASKPQAIEEAKLLAKKVLKFLLVLKESYEGQTDDSKIPTREQVTQLASKIFGTSFTETN